MVLIRFTTQAFVLLAYALLVEGLSIPEVLGSLDKRSDGFVKLDFVVNKNTTRKTSALQKRYPTSTLIPEGGSYDITLNLGSEGEPVTVALDTGSSDFWVLSSQFDGSDSSTYQSTGEPFSIGYVQGSAQGEFVTDTVAIPNGDSLSDFQFAVVTNAQALGTNGILGISYVDGEAISFPEFNYPNFPAALKNAGLISKNAYSLYLNDVGASSGSIIFGGYDTEKYSGSLVTLQDSNPNQSLEVNLNSVTTTQGNVQYAGIDIPLDSGTTLAYLPPDIISSIASDANLDYDVDDQIIFVNCTAQIDGNLGFGFEGITIQTSLQELVVNDNGTCYLGILGNNNSRGYNLLGDSFLRSAYLVYDLDDNVIQIAQAQYTTNSNIIPIQ